MKTIMLFDYLEAVRARKAALGLADTPESVEAMRNKGGNRTPAKRALLRRAARRAKAAGKTQVTSCF